jgi:hypothetical protein
MKSKPKGAKYRNLVAYRERIFDDRVIGGRRYWRDLKTTDWDDAIEHQQLVQRGVRVPETDISQIAYSYSQGGSA